jgi:hypothetical protein
VLSARVSTLSDDRQRSRVGHTAVLGWQRGEVIVRREVLNDGRPWLAVMVYVVEDSEDHLVTYLPVFSSAGGVGVGVQLDRPDE